MKNISRFLVALCCSALFLFSCENEIESEIQSSSEELVTSAETKALSVDSLEPLKMTDELKALKERMDELKKTKTRAASSNYGQYFSENMCVGERCARKRYNNRHEWFFQTLRFFI